MENKNLKFSENLRIKLSGSESRKFFNSMKTKTNSKNFKELSEKLEIPYGRMKLYLEASRTIPIASFHKWLEINGMEKEEFDFSIVDLDKVLKEARAKGFFATKNKYGQEWNKILGKRGKKSLELKLKEDKETYTKWRTSIRSELTRKYGKDAYSKRNIQRIRRGGRFTHALGRQQPVWFFCSKTAGRLL